MMKISEVIQILSAEVIWGDEKLCEREVQNACGSDLMSDVLAYVKDQSLLDRKSTRLNSSHFLLSRMPSSA